MSAQEERRLAKVQLSELRAAGKRVDNVIRELQEVRQDIGRKTEELQACVDHPPEDVSEYRLVRESCRPPHRSMLDTLKDDVSKLTSQELRQARVSTGLSERMEHLTVQHTASTAEGGRQQTDFLALARAERGAEQGADNQDMTDSADRGDNRSVAHPLLTEDRPGVNIYAKRVKHLRLFNVILTTDNQGTSPDDVSRAPEDARGRSARTHHRVEIGRCQDSLSIDLHQMHVQSGVGQDLQQAVESTLLAKFNWDIAEQYEERMNQLQTELDQQKQTIQTQLQEASRQHEALTREADSLRAQLGESQAREGAMKTELERRLTEIDQQQRAAEERAADLQRQLSEQQTMGEQRLRAMESDYQALRQRDQDNVMTFVLKLEKRDRLLLDNIFDRLNDRQHVRDVLQRLVRDFNIRLLGVDCGLRFLMETPVAQWVSVIERQLEVQRILGELLPDDVRQDVTWAPVTEYGDVDLQGDEPVTLQEPGSGDIGVDGSPTLTTLASVHGTAQQEVRINPMTATLRRVTTFSPRQDGDSKVCWITSIIATQDGRLITADFYNKRVKTFDIRNPDTVLSLTLEGYPSGLALLHDGLLAVTLPGIRRLYFVDVSGQPSVKSHVQTARKYCGVCAGTAENTLIVSCIKGDDGPAAVDVVTREGQLMRTVTDSNTLSDMSWPFFLCLLQHNLLCTTSARAGPSTGQLERTLGRGNIPHFCDVQQHLLISDSLANKVFCVELASGRHVSTLEHTDMKQPCQVATDQRGNIYIACESSQCVLVMSGEDGQYRRLLKGSQHGEGEYVNPRGVCIIDSQLVVTWRKGFYDSVVSVYELL